MFLPKCNGWRNFIQLQGKPKHKLVLKTELFTYITLYTEPVDIKTDTQRH